MSKLHATRHEPSLGHMGLAISMGTAHPIISAELVAAWSEIKQRHPELPELSAPESLVSESSSACGKELSFGRLLHEAAHAIALVRGIRDTSRSGRYHNRRFLMIAGELGMQYSESGSSVTKNGFSSVILLPATQLVYQQTIEHLHQALVDAAPNPTSNLEQLLHGPTNRKNSPAASGRVKATCGCGRNLYVTPTSLACAPILCGACAQPFSQQK